MVRSILRRRSTTALHLRSAILFWLRMTVLRLGRRGRWSARTLRQFSVRTFWEKLSVEKAVRKGTILANPSSVILLRMSLRQRWRVLALNSSQIWRAMASPSSALVKSTVSTESLSTPSIIFSYFSGSLIALIFFFTASRGTSFFSSFPSFPSRLSSLFSWGASLWGSATVGLLRGSGLEVGVPVTLGRAILVGVAFSSLTMLSLSMLTEIWEWWPCSNSSTSSSRLSSSSCASVLTRCLMSSQENSQLAKILEFSFSFSARVLLRSCSRSLSYSSTTRPSELSVGASLKFTPNSSTNLLASSEDFSSWCRSCAMISFPLSISPFPLRQNSSSPSWVPDSQESKRFSAVTAQDSQVPMVFSSITSSFFILRSTFSAISSRWWQAARSVLASSSWIFLKRSAISFLRAAVLRVRRALKASLRFLLVSWSSTLAFSSNISRRVSQILLLPCSTWSRLMKSWPRCCPKRAHLEQRRWWSTRHTSSTSLLCSRQISFSSDTRELSTGVVSNRSFFRYPCSPYNCNSCPFQIANASSSPSLQDRTALGAVKDSSLAEFTERVLVLFFRVSRKCTSAMFLGSRATRSSSTKEAPSGQSGHSILILALCWWLASWCMQWSQKVCPQAVRRRGRLASVNSFWQRGQVTSRSILLIASVIINTPHQLISMRKYAARSVLYLSQQCAAIDTDQPKFFPFLNSPLLHEQAMTQFLTTGLHAICNLDNIRHTLPHKQDFQEFVFFGRSNVGKSTLINHLVRRDFVETSKKPGKTKELAFLKIKSKLPTLLVDAPGYGYASDASKQEIMQWGRLVEYYLKHTSTAHQLVLVLVDAVHGFKDTDGMLLRMLHQMKKNFLIVLTKCDRAQERQLDHSIDVAREVQAKLSSMNFYLHLTSSRQEVGIAELRNHLLYKMAARQINEAPR